MFNPKDQSIDEDEEGTIDMAEYARQQAVDDDEGTIDMAEYAKSREAEESTWWDAAREAGIQTTLGLSQAFTWPLDVLKLGMVGEGLADIDELEDAFKAAGKPFDRNKYAKTVLEQGEFVPTQELLERAIQKKTGINLEPKTKTGKAFNKLFFLAGLSRGKGISKALKAGAVGAGTTAALREAGAPELVSELGGDISSGLGTLEKEARKLSPEAKRIAEVAEKHGLPLMDLMLEDTVKGSPKISAKRKAALEKELGMSSEEAIKKIVEEKIPVSKLRGQGKDLQVLEDEAYDTAKELGKKYKTPLNTDQYISDIDTEIARIKSLAPSPSKAQEAAIRILEDEKGKFTTKGKKGKAVLDAEGNPITSTKGKGKPATVEELVTQTQNYNSNVKSIYKKAEYSGVEDEVKNTYAFLNKSLRDVIEKQAGEDVSQAYKVANSIHGQNASLARTEGYITKAFQNGEFSPKKLNQVLEGKYSGAQIRKDIGKEGVKELKDIANFGTKAQAATKQFANSAKHKLQMGQWGPLAGFLLGTVPGIGLAKGAFATIAKPFFDYVKGWALTRPAPRKVYSNIIKNAAKGSFGKMSKDFATLESEIIDEFGSMEDFMKQGIRELEFYREGEENEL